jgi:outer membrane protein TolC
LALAIGGEAGSCFGVKERLIEKPIEKDVSELVRDAMIRRNDLRGMESRAQNARNEVRVAKADYLPTAYFSGAYELDDHKAPFRSEGSSWLVMVRLRWEAFDGLRRMAQMAKAKRIRHSSEEILEGMRKDVAFRVREKYLRLQEAKKRLEIAEKALADAEEGVRLVKVRYENALSSIVELLDAQTALNTARYNVVRTHNDYLLSQAEVRHRTGTFLRSVLED